MRGCKKLDNKGILEDVFFRRVTIGTREADKKICKTVDCCNKRQKQRNEAQQKKYLKAETTMERRENTLIGNPDGIFCCRNVLQTSLHGNVQNAFQLKKFSNNPTTPGALPRQGNTENKSVADAPFM